MAKKNKSARRQRGLQAVTLCISTTMVLILLGLVVFSVFTARNLSNYMKENLTVTVMLGDSVSAKDAKALAGRLGKRVYTRRVVYISKEQALKEQTAAMGSDPSEFLGANPFVATLELQLRSDYACRDSLLWIAEELKKNKAQVTEVAYQEDLMNSVNRNLQWISLVMLVLALLLTFVSFSLINNTVRLGIYSRRFIIHTMKLVGASWGFIRRPFVRQSLVIGLLAAILACCVLGGLAYALYYYQPGVEEVITWEVLAVTAISVFLFGIIITFVCSWISVNRFLRMRAGELYKI